MPRVSTQKAAKDYPSHGIKKGDTYYSWSFRYGGARKSKTPPRPSQLTQSKMSAALASTEAAEDAVLSADDPQAIADALREAAEGVREVAQEYQDAADAFEHGGGLAEANEEKADQLNEWADALDSDADDVENLDATDYIDDDVEVDGKKNGDREVSSFDNLTPEEQTEMLEAAWEQAGQNLGSAPF